MAWLLPTALAQIYDEREQKNRENVQFSKKKNMGKLKALDMVDIGKESSVIKEIIGFRQFSS